MVFMAFRSLVYKTNKREPKIGPWGTPDVTAAEKEVATELSLSSKLLGTVN